MINTMKNVVGGGDCWATDANGITQVIELDANDTSVTFTHIPDVDGYGFMLYVDNDNATDPTEKPPVPDGFPVEGTPSGGYKTVTFNFTSAITAGQAGMRAYLRIIK